MVLLLFPEGAPPWELAYLVKGLSLSAFPYGGLPDEGSYEQKEHDLYDVCLF